MKPENEALKSEILNLIKISNYIYSKEIEDMLGITGSQVRVIVRKLRREGHLISNTKIIDGKKKHVYSYGDMTLTNENLKKRALSLLKTINMNLKAQRLKGQYEIIFKEN